ncbi:MAG TPA: glutamyl-tRNA reductase [Paludibacter sp.]|nr:glutamyl-tRNA reductase [Paludibacter sp.]
MHLLVVGINFKTADVSIREKLHFSNEVNSNALDQLIQYKNINGSVILSTCNRVEIYTSVNNVDKGSDDVLDFISTFHNIPAESLLPVIYKKNCQDAVVHLFKVASSLDSMVLGEYQIQGQVRDAYFAAKENHSTNALLNKVFQTAIQIGKKVRSETKIGDGSVSVATLAVDMVKRIFEDRHDLNILLIGAGKISNLTATYLQQKFANCNITVTNRSDATELAKRVDGKLIEYSKRFAAIQENDVIIASTSAPNFIVCRHEISMMEEALQGKTRIFIDLSIPRNIDPEINKIDNCFVYSIDDINKMIDSNLDKRTLEVSKAEEIIREISEDYFEWYSKHFIMPTMAEIKKGLVVLKQSTLDLHEPFTNKLDETQKEELDKVLDAYSDRILKVIMSNLRKASTREEMISITKTLKDSFTIDIPEHE